VLVLRGCRLLLLRMDAQGMRGREGAVGAAAADIT
jgi:hypothetical protein